MGVIFIILLIAFSCGDRYHMKKFQEECPYDPIYSQHYLRVPITISPHKLTYKIGDTISINTVFLDSIYDLSTRETFKIEGFPFKPLSLLYRFDGSGEYESGYRVNDLTIDSIYNHVYNYSSNYADGYRAYTIYNSGKYMFESKLILRKAGIYILLFTDLYHSHSGSGRPDLNAEADAITFEGKCPSFGYYICSMIDSGDDHLDNFVDELVYLDFNVYRGNLRHVNGSATDPLGFGKISVEWNGFFGFEVVE